MNIIDEIAESRHYFSYEGKECNTIIIPEDRRYEIEKHIMELPNAWGKFTEDGKLKCFGCDVIFSHQIDKIKVGYMI